MSHSFRYAYSIYTLGSVIKLSPEWHMLMSANVKVSINPMWWKNEYVRCLIRDYQKCDHKEVQQNAVLYCITQIIKVKNNIPDIACNYQFRLKELHARKKFANWHYSVENWMYVIYISCIVDIALLLYFNNTWLHSNHQIIMITELYHKLTTWSFRFITKGKTLFIL